MKRPANRPIPIDRMRQYLAVDPTSRTGLRRVKVLRAANRVKVGQEAGSVTKDGYYRVMFEGIAYRVARIVYALHYDVDPGEHQVDHRNRNRLDNRIENLRLVAQRENNQNKSNHGLLPVGVHYDKLNKAIVARISICGKRKYLGSFPTPEMASAAYQKACAELQSNAEAASAE